jgi:transposase
MVVPRLLSRGGSTAMMGIKERNFRPLPENLSLENLIPRDNFYRCLEERLDLSFVKELVVEYYTAVGRPSIDPEVFFRLQLVTVL